MAYCKNFSNDFMRSLDKFLSDRGYNLRSRREFDCGCESTSVYEESDGYPKMVVELASHFTKSSSGESKSWGKWSSKMKNLVLEQFCEEKKIPQEAKDQMIGRVQYDKWRKEGERAEIERAEREAARKAERKTERKAEREAERKAAHERTEREKKKPVEVTRFSKKKSPQSRNHKGRQHGSNNHHDDHDDDGMLATGVVLTTTLASSDNNCNSHHDDHHNDHSSAHSHTSSYGHNDYSHNDYSGGSSFGGGSDYGGSSFGGGSGGCDTTSGF